MKPANRWKALPWVLGICVVAFSLVAANRLIHTPDTAAGGSKAPAKGVPNATPVAPGLTVLGTVDAPNGVARVDAPALPALSGMTVVDVLVKNGDKVKIGDELIKFDNSMFIEKVEQAKAEWNAAREDLVLAQKQIEDHPQMVKLQKLAVEKAQVDLKYATAGLKVTSDKLERVLQGNDPNNNFLPYTDAAKERLRRENDELLKAELAVESLKLAVTKEQTELERLQSKPIQSAKAMAEAKVKRLESTVREAQAVVDKCTLKAQVDGVVEQVAAVKGMTFGPTTRTAAMWIIPSGKRIVWAEVEAEFAYKIADQLGKKVTIYDSHNFNHGYEGTVKYIGDGFLPKRGSTDSLTSSNTKVLECEIEVTNAEPDGKPKLRVGQPVRVVFGQ